MSDERLTSLYLMSVYREKISKNKQGFIESVLDRFGRVLRRLQTVFPLRKFYTEKMFCCCAQGACNCVYHVETQTVKRSQR